MATISEKDWFIGWLLMDRLTEQQLPDPDGVDVEPFPPPSPGQKPEEGGVSPVRMGAAYFQKEELMQQVQKVVADLAPNGVQSQAEYLGLLDKALDQVVKDSKARSDDPALLADIDLTIAMIERSLRMVPFQVFFSHAGIKTG